MTQDTDAPTPEADQSDLGPHLLDDSLPTPLYHQIYLVLKDRIRSGEFRSEQVIPGEQELTRRFGVSRITVKRALNELAAHGLVTRQRGRGTVVTYNAAIPVVRGGFDGLLTMLKQMGLGTEVELLEVVTVAAGREVAEVMAVEVGAPVQRAVRLRRLEGETFSYLVTYVPGAIAAKFAEEDLRTVPLLTLLERAGVAAVEAEQTITAVAADPAVASALRIAPGSPLLQITRLMRDASGRPVQRVVAYYRPERFHYTMHLSRRADSKDGAQAWSADVDRP